MELNKLFLIANGMYYPTPAELQSMAKELYNSRCELFSQFAVSSVPSYVFNALAIGKIT